MYEAKVNQLGPYALKTLFIRLVDLESWAKRSWGYKQFVNEHARLFKHAYTKERFDVSVTELTANISSIQDTYIRTLAEGLFRNGLRISELSAFDKANRLVTGKGGKRRNLLAANSLPDRYPSARELRELRSELKRCGLKPHTLRKGAATLLARAGMQSQDLLHVMGWSSLQTAASYLQPQQDDVLAKFANNVLGGK